MNIHNLAKYIVPIVAVYKGERVIPLGTGFIVGTFSDNRAILVTASHIIGYAKSEDSQPSRHHITALKEFLPKEDPVYVWEHMKLFALFTDGKGTTVNANIDRCWFDKERDVAFCGISCDADINLGDVIPFKKKIRMQSYGPEIGDKVFAVGFPNVIDNSEQFENINAEFEMFSLDMEVVINEGYVANRFDTIGPGNHKWPCFQVTCPLLSGMSGGPILIEKDNELIACGVISSDINISGCAASGEHAFASLIWTSFYIETDIKHNIEGSNEDVDASTILSLVKSGVISDIDDACKNARIIYDDNGIPITIIWVKDNI